MFIRVRDGVLSAVAEVEGKELTSGSVLMIFELAVAMAFNGESGAVARRIEPCRILKFVI